MCGRCWAEAGYPLLRTPKVMRLAEDIKLADPYGVLHIFVDDWNADDSSIRYLVDCRDGRKESPCEWTLEDRACLTLAQMCSEEERYSALAHADGYDETSRDQMKAEMSCSSPDK